MQSYRHRRSNQTDGDGDTKQAARKERNSTAGEGGTARQRRGSSKLTSTVQRRRRRGEDDRRPRASRADPQSVTTGGDGTLWRGAEFGDGGGGRCLLLVLAERGFRRRSQRVREKGVAWGFVGYIY
ncbi:hypothetical protein S83_062582 [Arachis hypogaea]